MDKDAAARDLALIRDVMRRAERRVDPHAFHYVHWGLIVLVWYPVGNFLEQRGQAPLLIWLGLGALALGVFLSIFREKRLEGSLRLAGENVFLARQVMWITFSTIGAGILLSVLAPATGFVDGHDVPTLWGLVYATMAAMVGIVYRVEFLLAGAVIFLAAVAAMFLPAYNGYILGPAMGLGLAVPGLLAERRVRTLAGDGALV
jgi:hypothetical protein